MQITPVTDNLIQITRLRFVNAFLVREEDGFTLVDTTLRAADGLIEAARQAGGDIRRIALTHGHSDHTGSLDALRERLGPSVPVSMPEEDARILRGEKVDGKKPPGGWPKLKTTPDVLLHPGERVGSLEVVPTPGHTPGHVSYLDTRDRSVIAGDVFVSIGGVTVTDHFHARFPLAWMATWDNERDRESARTLRALDPSVLVVGHGAPTRDPGPAMDRAIG